MHTLLSSTQARLAVFGLVSVFTILAVPMAASAATFAYVDRMGEVRMVTADAPLVAIATAPNIHAHSGVLQLMAQTDYELVGDKVNGI